jgi:hypothetical protein
VSATIYKKSGNDNCLLLQARTGAWRKFNFGDWTEIRIGMFHCGVRADGGYVSHSIASEMVKRIVPTDDFVFGLKSETGDLHGTAGTNFVGVSTDQEHYITDGQYAWGSAYRNFGRAPCTYYGTASAFGSQLDLAEAAYYHYYAEREDGYYNGFKGLKFTVLNKGSVSQSIQIATTADWGVPPYTIAALSSSLKNASYTNFANTMSWSTSYPIPNCLYIWNPYYLHGIRISAWDALKIS